MTITINCDEGVMSINSCIRQKGFVSLCLICRYYLLEDEFIPFSINAIEERKEELLSQIRRKNKTKK